jgi:late competence protein required for DNA uptake (superfamily II DNA/RNA helicase)
MRPSLRHLQPLNMDANENILHHKYVDILMKQMDVFQSVTLRCDRCSHQVSINSISSTAKGMYCEKCIFDMPLHEFEHLLKLTEEAPDDDESI